jgi:hypothetical protein
VDLIPNARAAQQDVRTRFLEALGNEVTGNYDEHEGASLFDKVRNYREYWVAYN